MRNRCAIRFALLGMMLLLSACGSGEAVPDSGTRPTAETPSANSSPARLDRSGSRLVVRGYTTDGIFVRDGIYDTKLALMCVPGLASDGLERCVPRDVLPFGPYADGADGGPDYAEATCSTPLITIAKRTCADPARVVVRSSSEVGDRNYARYWRIGEPTHPATIYPASFGCSEVAPNPAYDYYERGAPLLPTDFVAFVRQDVAVSPALHAVVLEGEDGSRLQTEQDFIDVVRGQPCEIALAEDGVSRCTPQSAYLYLNRAFTDASCLKPAASGLSCSAGLGKCDDSTVMERLFADASVACGSDRHRFYAAGPVATSALHFGSGPAECSGPITQTSTILEVGAPIEPTAFPPFLPGSVAAQSRLVERTLLVVGAPVKQSATFDPQIDDECHVETAADGKVRCLPAHAVVATGGFADATCTTPLFSPIAPCLPMPKYARIVEGSSCDPIVRIHAVTVATHAFQRRDGACVEVPLHPETYVAGDEVPATTFAEATPTTL